jgi:hypothetical protein
MPSLILQPPRASGGETVKLTTLNRPDIDLSRAVSVTLSQTGVGGAIHVRTTFNAISSQELHVSIPPVGPSFNGSNITPGSYRVFVQIPGLNEESTQPLQVLTVASSPTPTATPAPAPSGSIPATTSATPASASAHPVTYSIIPGSAPGTALIQTPSGTVSVPLGTPHGINLAGGPVINPLAAAISGHTAAINQQTTQHGCNNCSSCGCSKQCCCSCCNSCQDTTAQQVPPAAPPPSTVTPPYLSAPGIAGRPQPGSTMAGPSSGSQPGTASAPPNAEMKVRWLVESSAPILEGDGPDSIATDSDPELYTNLMGSSTDNGGSIPIEPLDDGSTPIDNPPIRLFNFIVSTQVLTPGNHPIEGEKVTFQWHDALDITGDESEILEVSNDLSALKTKLVNNEAADKNDYAYSNAEGKAFCWIRLRLYDENDLADMEKRLKVVKAVVGESVRPVIPASLTSTGLHSVVRPPVGSTTSSTAPNQQPIFNILVNPGVSAIESFGEWINGQLEFLGGLPRTKEEVIGFALKRLADGIILMYPMPGYTRATLAGFEDELRSMVIGLLLGLPRGVYAMGRDTIQDLKMLVFDLPRALFNLIAKDPKFALQVIGSIISPTTGAVMYGLDSEFRDQINKAFSKFRGLLENISTIIGTLWTTFRDQITFSGITDALGTYLYNDFSKFVGFIGTDYLKYRKDDGEYRHFVGGFIAGDILGYIVTTIGVELLLAWFTAGIGNIISVVSKLGRLGRLAASGLRVVEAFIRFIQRIGEIIGEVISAIGTIGKNAIGRLMGFLVHVLQKLFHPLAEHIIEPLFDALMNLADEIRKDVMTMLYRWSHPDGDLTRKADDFVNGIIDGTELTPPDKLKDVLQDTLELLSFTAKDKPGTNIAPNMLICY